MKLVDRFRPGSKRLQADPSVLCSHDPSRIFLLRHGQISGHGTKRYIGQSDIALDENGREQALFWHRVFSGIRFEAVFSSTLDRCCRTAEIIASGKPVSFDKRLNEISLGTWEGRAFEDVKNTMPDRYRQRGEDAWGFRPENGESFMDLYDRVSPFFSALKTQEREHPVLVITHSGVIRVMLHHWLGLVPEQLFSIRPSYGMLYILSEQA